MIAISGVSMNDVMSHRNVLIQYALSDTPLTTCNPSHIVSYSAAQC
jgi:hypothetical protein